MRNHERRSLQQGSSTWRLSLVAFRRRVRAEQASACSLIGKSLHCREPWVEASPVLGQLECLHMGTGRR